MVSTIKLTTTNNMSSKIAKIDQDRYSERVTRQEVWHLLPKKGILAKRITIVFTKTLKILKLFVIYL